MPKPADNRSPSFSFVAIHWPIVALALLAVVIGLPGNSAGQTGSGGSASDSNEIAETVLAFHRALASGDSAAALALLAPDVIILESGEVETLSEYRSHHLSADIAFAKAVESERGPARVAVNGDAAWVSSTSTTEGEHRGRRVDAIGAELMVLGRREGRWEIRAIHWSSRSRPPRP